MEHFLGKFLHLYNPPTFFYMELAEVLSSSPFFVYGVSVRTFVVVSSCTREASD